jgi:hypothetical protein
MCNCKRNRCTCKVFDPTADDVIGFIFICLAMFALCVLAIIAGV